MRLDPNLTRVTLVVLSFAIAVGAVGPWSAGSERSAFSKIETPFIITGIEGPIGITLFTIGVLTAACVLAAGKRSSRGAFAVMGGSLAALVATWAVLTGGNPRIMEMAFFTTRVDVQLQWGLLLAYAASNACIILGLLEAALARRTTSTARPA